MRSRAYLIMAGLLIALLPSLGWCQVSTVRSEIDQWIKESAHQSGIPIGTKITTQNWQQYKAFLPLGMQKLFAGYIPGRFHLMLCWKSARLFMISY